MYNYSSGSMREDSVHVHSNEQPLSLFMGRLAMHMHGNSLSSLRISHCDNLTSSSVHPCVGMWLLEALFLLLLLCCAVSDSTPRSDASSNVLTSSDMSTSTTMDSARRSRGKDYVMPDVLNVAVDVG